MSPPGRGRSSAASGFLASSGCWPRTNGKVERLIRTSVEEWAYARPYQHSKDRTAALDVWLRYYNSVRRHSGIGRLTPPQRLVEIRVTNVLATHT